MPGKCQRDGSASADGVRCRSSVALGERQAAKVLVYPHHTRQASITILSIPTNLVLESEGQTARQSVV